MDPAVSAWITQLDISKYVHEMLGDLESNVIAAVILVMIVDRGGTRAAQCPARRPRHSGAFLGGVAAFG